MMTNYTSWNRTNESNYFTELAEHILSNISTICMKPALKSASGYVQMPEFPTQKFCRTPAKSLRVSQVKFLRILAAGALKLAADCVAVIGAD